MHKTSEGEHPMKKVLGLIGSPRKLGNCEIMVKEISKGEHELFLSKQEALEHKEWRLRMKDRYLEQKTELKKICLSYLKEGRWIKPSDKS